MLTTMYRLVSIIRSTWVIDGGVFMLLMHVFFLREPSLKVRLSKRQASSSETTRDRFR